MEDRAVLDIRVLRRRGRLAPGQFISTTTRWDWHLKGQTFLRAHINADMRDLSSSRVVIAYEVAGQTYAQIIAVTWRPSPFNGSRAFFICPVSGKACEVLVLGTRGFASPAANGVTYKSQSKGSVDRMLLARCKLHGRLWPLDGHRQAVRGEKRKRLEERYWALEIAVEEALDQALEGC